MVWVSPSRVFCTYTSHLLVTSIRAKTLCHPSLDQSTPTLTHQKRNDSQLLVCKNLNLAFRKHIILYCMEANNVDHRNKLTNLKQVKLNTGRSYQIIQII